MTDTSATGTSSPPGGSQQSPPAAANVSSTLAELERKLRELEQELSTIGRRREPAAAAIAQDPAPAYEPVPNEARSTVDETQPVISWNPPPADALRTPTDGRLIDEAVESEPSPSVERRAPLSSSAPSDPAPVSAAPRTAQPTGLAELWRFRERLERFTQELGEEYGQALERATAELATGPPPPPSVDDTLFEGQVELGVGPFYDMGSLSTFERAVAGLPQATDVAVRRFEASHAVLDLRLTAPTALIRELRGTLSAELYVREIAGGRLMLSFDDA